MARIPGVDGLIDLLHTRTGALGRLPATVASLAGAVRGAVALVGEARATLATVHRVAVRVEALVDELEEPLTTLAPGLRRLAALLDDPVVRDLPDTLRAVRDDLLPVVRILADTHERVAFIAGSTERILAFADQTSRSLAGLPGAGLLGRRRPPPPASVITVEQLDR